jgi:hypothetical protein
MKHTCPECEAEIEIPDDPRLSQMVDAMNTMQKTLEKYADKIEKSGGERPNVPVAEIPGVTVKGKKGDVLYEGAFVQYVLDEDES